MIVINVISNIVGQEKKRGVTLGSQGRVKLIESSRKIVLSGSTISIQRKTSAPSGRITGSTSDRAANLRFLPSSLVLSYLYLFLNQFR